MRHCISASQTDLHIILRRLAQCCLLQACHVRNVLNTLHLGLMFVFCHAILATSANASVTLPWLADPIFVDQNANSSLDALQLHLRVTVESSMAPFITALVISRKDDDCLAFHQRQYHVR